MYNKTTLANTIIHRQTIMTTIERMNKWGGLTRNTPQNVENKHFNRPNIV